MIRVRTETEFPKIETLYERDPVTFKVQPERLKNPVYRLLKAWQWTEKVDGMNLRCIWRDGILAFGGKTDKAQLPPDLLKWLSENVQADKMRAIFPDTEEVVIYGESYGAGIQKGGAYSPIKRMVVFDVLVDGTWWLNWDNVCDVAAKLDLETVPFLGEMPLEAATEMVRAGFPSRLGACNAEGLVGRPEETLFDKKGARLITKLKTKDF